MILREFIRDVLNETINEAAAINVVAYHGGKFDGINPDIKHGDFGMHFGTLEQAKYQANNRGGKVGKYKITIHKPIFINDDMGWWGNAELWATHLPNDYSGGDNKDNIIDALIDQGYDGAVYDNTVEGDGQSYIVFDEKCIKFMGWV